MGILTKFKVGDYIVIPSRDNDIEKITRIDGGYVETTSHLLDIDEANVCTLYSKLNKHKIKIGDKVKISLSSFYYKYQGNHGVGIVTDYDKDSKYYSVLFKDGYNNSYRNYDLNIVKDKEQKYKKYSLTLIIK